MKRTILFLFVLVLLVAGCATPAKRTDTVFQTSTINALLAGIYDGDITLREVLENGDFGLGTYNHLAGEMILYESQFYQIKPDGSAYRPVLSTKTPYVTVCRFKADETFPTPEGFSMDDVKKFLDHRLPNHNLFYAIKITGVFKTMKTRTIVAQKKPYPPLKEVVKHQIVFHMKEVAGTIVGFRCPEYIKGINVPNYHLHFISKDGKRGGHVLGFTLRKGRCEIDMLNRFLMVLPSGVKEFAKANLSKDQSKALKRVEQK